MGKEFRVFDASNTLVRTYSDAVHGKGHKLTPKELAEQFISKAVIVNGKPTPKYSGYTIKEVG